MTYFQQFPFGIFRTHFFLPRPNIWQNQKCTSKKIHTIHLAVTLENKGEKH